jgi:hypothetical protein
MIESKPELGGKGRKKKKKSIITFPSSKYFGSERMSPKGDFKGCEFIGVE